MSWMAQTLSAQRGVDPSSISWRPSLSLAAPGLDDCSWPGLEWRPASERAVAALLTRNQLRAESHVRDIAVAFLASLWSADMPLPNRLLPQAFQLPGGGMQLEWHAGSDHVEVSIEASGVVGLYIDSTSGSFDVEVVPSRSPIPRVLFETIQRITTAAWDAHAAR
mgnify:CR=1 FL=1